MTSLAANNILPLRIGDIMRVFTYAGDLGASPSVILSTVILEKLLDIFILVLLFTLTMGSNASAHSKAVAETLLAISTVGLLTLDSWRAHDERVRSNAFLPRHAGNAQSGSKIAKIEHWIMLALDCLLEIGIAGSDAAARAVGDHLVLRGHDLRLGGTVDRPGDGLDRAVAGGLGGEPFVPDS